MRRTVPLLLFLSAMVVRLVIFLITSYTVDDAFITFRYAENLASGLGFVYNAGEQVLGTTTPLFTLLLAIGYRLGAGCVDLALIISLLASGLTAAVLYYWARRIGLENLAPIPAVLYALFPRSITSDICGLETALFTLLLVAAFYTLQRRRFLIAITCASLAAVTRPEGVALLLGVVLISLVMNRRHLLLRLVPILLIVGNWLLFSYSYFDTLIPNSIPAKQALYHAHWRLEFLPSLGYLLGLSSPIGWLLLALFLLGMLRLIRLKSFAALAGAFAAAYLLVLAFAGTHIFFWYPAPVYPLLFLAAGCAIRWMAGSLRQRPSGWLTAAIVFVIALASLWRLEQRVDYLRWEMDCYATIHRAAGNYLAQHTVAEEIVLAEDIGQLGYYYRGRIVDRDGLVTPAAIPYNRAEEYGRFIDSVGADWIFIADDLPTSRAIFASKNLWRSYTAIRSFTCTGGNTYRLFRKTRATQNAASDEAASMY